jgi:hypothetical protein
LEISDAAGTACWTMRLSREMGFTPSTCTKEEYNNFLDYLSISMIRN